MYPRVAVDSVPVICLSAELLARHGYQVDLFTCTSAQVPTPTFESPAVAVRSLGTGNVAEGGPPVPRALRTSPRARRLLAPVARGYRAARGLASWASAAWSRTATLARVSAAERERPYTCFIGVDPDGLVLADRLARRVHAALAYLSLELLLSNELRSAGDVRLKARERALCRQSAFVMIQDELRGRLLADDNGIPWERLALVPNAPLGPARRRLSDYWRRRFDLSPEQRVVLHSGSLGGWTGIDEIVASAPTWPPGWVLVVHTRYDAGTSAYVDGLRARADPTRVFFSLKPVPRQEYDQLIDGADLGVAFYVPTDDSSFTQTNVQAIGLSSGKLAYYLRAALPVVVNDASSIGEVVAREGCGVSVAGASEIAAAISRIARKYDRYAGQAGTFFDRHLDFARAFEDVLRRVDALDEQRKDWRN